MGMMDSELFKELVKGFPNLMGLVLLSFVLWTINSQTSERLDRQFEYLVACLSGQGLLP